jgi:hypothetical protein
MLSSIQEVNRSPQPALKSAQQSRQAPFSRFNLSTDNDSNSNDDDSDDDTENQSSAFNKIIATPFFNTGFGSFSNNPKGQLISKNTRSIVKKQISQPASNFNQSISSTLTSSKLSSLYRKSSDQRRQFSKHTNKF